MSSRGIVLCAALLSIAAPAHAQTGGGFTDAPRLRFGLDGGIGGLVDAHGLVAFGFGGSARAGVQITESFAMFLAGRVTGAVTQADGTSATGVVGGGMLGADVTIDHAYQVGLGLGVDGTSSSWCPSRPGPCFAPASPGFGLEARFAYMLSYSDYPMPIGFPVAVALHGTVIPDLGLTASLTLSLGIELY